MIATLSAVSSPIACLPGNHDRYRLPKKLPTYLPGGKVFDKKVLDYQSEPVRKFVIPPDADLQVVVFAADLTLKRLRDCRYGAGWIAQGRVYHGENSILEKLVEETRRERADIARNKPGTHLCILWAVHFPPEFPDQSRLHKLIDEHKLLEKADEIGVHGILAGHTHDQKKYRDTDPQKVPVFCCGTSSQHEPVTSVQNPTDKSPTGNFFQILTVSIGPGGAIQISRDEYRYGVTAEDADMTEKHWYKYTR